MSSSDKWNCSRCTYENWPRALRCTLCGAGRAHPPAPLIEETEPRAVTPPPASAITQQHHQKQSVTYNGSNNATAVHGCTGSPSSNQNSSPDTPIPLSSLGSLSLSSPGPLGKWPCPKCTYLNWPKSARCVQCRGSRPGAALTKSGPPGSPATSSLPRSPSPPTRGSPEASTSNTITGATGLMHQQQQQPPQHNTLTTITSNATAITTTGTISTSTLSSPTNASNDLIGAGGDPGGGSGGSGQKWTCLMCTYANWPKSQRCVMCYTFRNANNNNNTNGITTPGSPQFGSSARASTPPVIIETSADSGEAGGSCENEEAELNNYLSTMRSSNRQQQLGKNNSISSADRLWLNACLGILEENFDPVLRYVESGKDIFRTLTNVDVQHLRALLLHHQQPGSLYIEPGLSLIYLCVKLQREDMLAHLLTALDNTGAVVPKRVPSEVCQETAADIRRHVAASFKQRKGTDFACYFVTDNVTFALPSEIEHLHPSVQKILFDELLDRDVQKELEEESPIINWSMECTQRLGSRLYALWNRSAGDCLLDSVLQATWGVFDRDNTLRRILADSLCDAAASLYPRWKEAEAWQANLNHYTLAEAQWQEDWAVLVSLASQPGAALEQLHIFTLAHVFRRPIIVYGVKCIKSFRGEDLGLARFEGIYLPLLWECPSFCWKSPIALGYTRGHFSALVPIEPPDMDVIARGGAHSTLHRQDDIIYLPLMSADRKLLPIHFLTEIEMGQEEELIREWLDFRVTESGLLVALQRLQPPMRRPSLVMQMLDEWLHLYRTLSVGKNATNARLNQLLSMAAERNERHNLSCPGGQGGLGGATQQQQNPQRQKQRISEDEQVSESE
ncbi:ubiquitin thioesterase zranb1-B-like isoform X1 [Varroa destructor]|uniref:ubiquitinyl hydrolase 1 n=1 Tax=Varroa destructor TaxID=109461 RepID=A0A7M7KY37_VARDE|nr:ubiquitin thioesterase zranb1-B-like isoform X1 [Varroa destructor]XP_022672284.1 ubiquitin thioesterase zranb1-B-like isoform X1 [Varroa destructor]XP_022672285.1 ubiquitin thioesterase zranb1-B-like isoform X1 [Varroa destructor]XP_022672288.1 ubiquitin thioesterase zranb1-B-like isoform X1 [Varroa destructor]XP_022672289.1 ubiquitin thioesterase zranb1-B-like isoform X1 [Varroa destructor]XP_022672290.1 ubiquitin thioesterase zranb1-B-like isoform X1 [Varroa destructor]XP_022672291.1 ub